MRPEEKHPKTDEVFAHMTPKPEICVGNPPTAEHEFTGWRMFADGNGGEQACKHCGLGAMTYSLWTGF
jgi:hypothetical protein